MKEYEKNLSFRDLMFCVLIAIILVFSVIGFISYFFEEECWMLSS